MNEIDILLAKPIDIQVGDKTYTFRHPSAKWWMEFISAIGGLMSTTQTKSTLANIFSGRYEKQAEKTLALFCETIGTKPNDLLKDLTLHQLLFLLDKWIDCIGIEEAQSFLKGLGTKIEAAFTGPKTTP